MDEACPALSPAFPTHVQICNHREKMHHTVRVFLVVCAYFVKANQQQIIKISSLFSKFWNDWDFPLSVSQKLVSQHDLTRPVVIILFCHNAPPVYK